MKLPEMTLSLPWITETPRPCMNRLIISPRMVLPAAPASRDNPSAPATNEPFSSIRILALSPVASVLADAPGCE
jgi:hypothetical protein